MAGMTVDYYDGDTICEGYIALPATSGPAPAILVIHQWAGLGEQERETADRLAALGYVGYAVDVYGKGVRGDPNSDNSALLAPWFSDRAALLKRLMAAVTFASAHEAVESRKIAAIGYCFGGLCALDIARTGTDAVKGAISLHGVFAKPNLGEQAPIKTKILVCHGYDDPMATPEAMVGLADELTGAGADWQIHAYGNTSHAFTRKSANNPEHGLMYNANADRRSWQSIEAFLTEIF